MHARSPAACSTRGPRRFQQEGIVSSKVISARACRTNVGRRGWSALAACANDSDMHTEPSTVCTRSGGRPAFFDP
ncbi:hypothetical protein A8H35_16175 [Burkholderia thailandensis]|nr:hypothetical protein A8H35_16175 [Burkholderia thailandensis]NOK40787.1 hypothetical protein [Burkholderia thailandensis]PNE67652.1 hypothetical protein A8H38_15385 [Burkholderia thailandensis]PNE79650.1 hypothetical protein A8H34_15930 [Burkholderia thailandensis]PNE85590.1 hypothetical protein A8H30_15580 [Burkholderia thailandensis]